MNYNGKLDIISKLEWAIDTIRDQLLFGRDELGAAKARELRAKGVMLDTVKEVKLLQSQNEIYRKALEKISNDRCPDSHDVFAEVALQDAQKLAGGK